MKEDWNDGMKEQIAIQKEKWQILYKIKVQARGKITKVDKEILEMRKKKQRLNVLSRQEQKFDRHYSLQTMKQIEKKTRRETEKYKRQMDKKERQSLDERQKLKQLHLDEERASKTAAQIQKIMEENQQLENEIQQQRLRKDQLLKKLAQAQYELKQRQRTRRLEQKNLIELEDSIKEAERELEEQLGNLRVFVRIKREQGSSPRCVKCLGRNVLVFEKSRQGILQKRLQPKKYVYSSVFSQDSTQQDVYNKFSKLVSHLFIGKSLIVLAYGHSGSGKTFTLLGDMESIKETFQDNYRGIIPRTFQTIKSHIQKKQEYMKNIIFGINCFQFKMEEKQQKDKIYSNQFDCSRFIDDYQKIYRQIILEIKKKRPIKKTFKSSASSRSHLLIEISISGMINICSQGNKLSAKLTFADLAGNERIDTSSSSTSTDLFGTKSKKGRQNHQQTKYINSSLSTLRNVINRDYYQGKTKSLMSKHMQECMESKGLTIVFGNVSPLTKNEKETNIILNSINDIIGNKQYLTQQGEFPASNEPQQ